jgi:hypothetical protein
MTDREILLIAYGAIKAVTDDDGDITQGDGSTLNFRDLVHLLRRHLFPAQNENATSPK